MASAELLVFEHQLADVLLGGGVFRKLLVDGDGFGVLMILFVQAGEFQQGVAIGGIELRGGAEMRRGVGEPVLLDQRVRQAQFGGGGFCIQIESCAVLIARLWRRRPNRAALGPSRAAAGTLWASVPRPAADR